MMQCRTGIALLSLSLAILNSGCVSQQHGSLIQARILAGGDSAVLSAAADAVTSLGYRPYLGNPGMVVGHERDPTVLTPLTLVGGLALVPLAIVTWPLATIGSEHDSAAWWPLLPLAPFAASFDERSIYVSVTGVGAARCTVTAEAVGSEPARNRDIDALWAFLGARFEVIGAAEPVEWSRAGAHPRPRDSPGTP